jgi:hypothetical protein
MPQSPEHSAGSADPEINSLKEEVERLRRENTLLRKRLDREHIESLPATYEQRAEVSPTIHTINFSLEFVRQISKIGTIGDSVSSANL